jgi:hypothetical protein
MLRAVMFRPLCTSPPITTRFNVCTPAGNGRNLAPASRATVARSVASRITLATTAWRPARLAITMPHGLPEASRSTSVG